MIELFGFVPSSIKLYLKNQEINKIPNEKLINIEIDFAFNHS